MHKAPQPVKLWYLGPFFRQEKPQAGRFREFWQLGIEAIGSDDPAVDAEAIVLLHAVIAGAGRRAACGCGWARWARPRRARRLPREADRAPARARGRAERGGPRADRPQPAARVRRRPPGHARGHEGRAAADRPPDAPRTPSTSPRSGRAWTRPRSPTRSTRRSCAASTTTRARCSSSPPTRLGAQSRRRRRRALRRARRGARSARDVRASAGRRASSACCWPASTGREPEPVCDLYVAGTGVDAFALAAEARSRGPERADGAGGALAQGPDEAGRPVGRVVRRDLRRRGRGKSR